MKKESIIKAAVSLVLSFLFCFLCVTDSNKVLTWFSYVAFESAARYIPKIVYVDEADSNETVKESESKKEEVIETKAQNLTVALEEKETTAVSKTESASSNKSSQEFLVLPNDIKEMMDEAKKKGQNDKKEGSVVERQYKDEGVTDKLGSVKVKNTNSTKIDLSNLMEKEADISVNKEEPAVLIFHTHTTESYQYIDRDFYSSSYTTRNNSADRNTVRIGDAIQSEIEKAGYIVIHDTTVHDFKYSGAYSRSRKTVEAYLEKYPSIKVVYDIHRDAISTSSGTKIKPTTLIDGKKTAQVMIISGCQESGNSISGFENWQENLVFALKLQKEMEETFPTLTRPVFFCGRKYNMDLTTASLLIEVGSDSNTIEEAYYAGLCIGKATAQLLENYEEK